MKWAQNSRHIASNTSVFRSTLILQYHCGPQGVCSESPQCLVCAEFTLHDRNLSWGQDDFKFRSKNTDLLFDVNAAVIFAAFIRSSYSYQKVYDSFRSRPPAHVQHYHPSSSPSSSSSSSSHQVWKHKPRVQTSSCRSDLNVAGEEKLRNCGWRGNKGNTLHPVTSAPITNTPSSLF